MMFDYAYYKELDDVMLEALMQFFRLGTIIVKMLVLYLPERVKGFYEYAKLVLLEEKKSETEREERFENLKANGTI